MASSNLEFSKLSSAVSLYTPPSITTSNQTPNTDPTTIIICQWMGATPRSRSLNIAYQRYHTLYPTSQILTLRSLPSYFLSTPTSARLEGFSPAITAIHSKSGSNSASNANPKPRILIHLFSNGGALTFTDICKLYRDKTGTIMPIQAMILDSAPGNPTIQENWTAVSIGMPKGLAWYPTAALFAAFLAAGAIGRRVFGIYGLVYKAYGLLNDGELVDDRAKRLYVFSEGDELVGWRDVEGHLEEFRRKGRGQVMVLKEKETAHVQHMILHAERYWEYIEELWRTSGSGA